MSVINQFVAFAIGAAPNVEDIDTYIASSTVANGVISGQASSAFANRSWRQSSVWAATLGQLIVNQLGVSANDDGNLSTLLTNFQNAILALTSIYAPLASPVLTGVPLTTVPANPNDNSTKIPTTSWVQTFLSAFARLNSPAFTGVPLTTVPANPNDNSTKIPTTSWVQTLLSSLQFAAPNFSCDLPSGSSGSAAHGLGVVPTQTLVSLVCTKAFGVYNVGDKMLIGGTGFRLSSGESSHFYPYATSALVGFSSSNNLGALAVPAPSTTVTDYWGTVHFDVWV